VAGRRLSARAVVVLCAGGWVASDLGASVEAGAAPSAWPWQALVVVVVRVRELCFRRLQVGGGGSLRWWARAVSARRALPRPFPGCASASMAGVARCSWASGGAARDCPSAGLVLHPGGAAAIPDGVFPLCCGAAWRPGRWCQSTAGLGSPGSAVSGWAVVWSRPDRAGFGRSNLAPFRPVVSFSVPGRLGWGVWLPVPLLQAVGASVRLHRRLALRCVSGEIRLL
jgi:hypothetical protein